MNHTKALSWGLVCALALGVASGASARPGYLAAFKAHYKTAMGKPTLNGAMCNLCHQGPPAQAMWNAYGQEIRKALGARNVSDQAKIIAALTAAEKGKANPNAQRTFGQIIATDRPPVGGGRPAAGTQPARPTTPATGTTTARPGNITAGPIEPVFNGVNMDGLTKMNAGNWAVQGGVLKYLGGGNGWMRTNKQYQNYSAVIVWRFTESGPNDAGIFLRAGTTGNPWPTGAPQLNMGPGDNFGSISGTQGSVKRGDLVKPLDWNTYQITVYNGAVTLAINGTKAWEKATGVANQPGYIGIQCENRKFDVAQFWVQPLR